MGIKAGRLLQVGSTCSRTSFSQSFLLSHGLLSIAKPLRREGARPAATWDQAAQARCLRKAPESPRRGPARDRRKVFDILIGFLARPVADRDEYPGVAPVSK